MASDHRKLRVFHEAHRLTLAIYKHTKNFPKEEWYGLRAQIRKAAVSIPTNIVEGSARRSTRRFEFSQHRSRVWSGGGVPCSTDLRTRDSVQEQLRRSRSIVRTARATT